MSDMTATVRRSLADMTVRHVGEWRGWALNGCHASLGGWLCVLSGFILGPASQGSLIGLAIMLIVTGSVMSIAGACVTICAVHAMQKPINHYGHEARSATDKLLN